jgi:hypothetical protein
MRFGMWGQRNSIPGTASKNLPNHPSQFATLEIGGKFRHEIACAGKSLVWTNLSITTLETGTYEPECGKAQFLDRKRFIKTNLRATDLE